MFLIACTYVYVNIKNMEIVYKAHSCFEIKGKNLTIVTDPYDPKIGYKKLNLKADVVTVSHDHFDHAYLEGVSEYQLLVSGPGEYEIKDTFINGLSTFHDDKKGEERGKNTIYVIEVDGFSILHLGDLGHELSKDTIENLPDIDILLIPVGGVFTINAKVATKVISSLEPGIAIPMHYQTKMLDVGEKIDKVDVFLHEMGIEDVKTVDKLKLKSKSDVPAETEVFVLSPTS